MAPSSKRPSGGYRKPMRKGLKYRLFYGRPGERIVCYDNERGKGGHKHVCGVETPYHFKSVDQLIEDFENDVRKAGGEL